MTGILVLRTDSTTAMIIHFTDHSSIWIQELFNKTGTVPWYTTASIGYTRSW